MHALTETAPRHAAAQAGVTTSGTAAAFRHIHPGSASFTESTNNNEFKSDLFNDKLKQIDDIINNIYNLELNVFKNNITTYYLNYEYFELCLDWTKNSSLQNVNQIEYFIGDFVKKMIKIHNIIEDIKFLCPILNKNELLQKLTPSVGLILKGIVNINSIYLL